ncbi:LysR family transcriptional regulator [Streptomyces sp. NBC_01390]|uniref:LysR family transcriptional regulator n=1 Tax=Streptomyces sp. NBC_01390 TaxID=2903850 RepID=UPI00324D4141
MSPSALTPQIQHLERDLQGQLLIRCQHGHPMRLTDLGEKVLAAARPYADQLGPGDGQERKDEDREARSATGE